MMFKMTDNYFITGLIYRSPKENEMPFIEPVVPEVNTISSLFPALMNDSYFFPGIFISLRGDIA